jgi:hypothetical protein
MLPYESSSRRCPQVTFCILFVVGNRMTSLGCCCVAVINVLIVCWDRLASSGW